MEEENEPILFFTACKGTLKDPQRFPSAQYQGKKVYFCNLACLRAFQESPEAFMAGEIPHPKPNEAE